MRPSRTGNNLVIALVALFSLLTISPTPIHAQPSTALILDPVHMTLDMNHNGSTILTLDATVTNIGLSSLSEVSFRVETTDSHLISAHVNGISTEASVTKLERYSIVTVNIDGGLSVDSSTPVQFQLGIHDMQTDGGLSPSGDLHYFDAIFYIRPLFTYRNITLVAKLPAYSMLSEESVSPLFPTVSGNFTDGRTLVFLWFTNELQPGQEKVFIIRYQIHETSVATADVTGVQLLLIGASLIPIGILLGLMLPKIHERLRDLRRVRYVGVTHEEEEVIDAIRNKGGFCSQKELYSDLGISQAKVSLILTALEERGLVRRFKEGRENIVHIIEE